MGGPAPDLLHLSKSVWRERAIKSGGSNQYKFTGKERDTETGLDYFGARYYGSNMGRWMSPDWASAPIAVPYAQFADPQSLNLYSYVRNSPVARFDIDGHADDPNSPTKRFTKALRNLFSVKTTTGVGLKAGVSFLGLKLSAGAAVETEIKTYPIGDKPTEVTEKAGTSAEIKILSGKAKMESPTPTYNPETGKIDRQAPTLSLSTDGEVPIMGLKLETSLTKGMKAGAGGAELVMNTPELATMVKTVGPALMESLGVLTGFTGGSGLPNNPLPGLKLPSPIHSGGDDE